MMIEKFETECWRIPKDAKNLKLSIVDLYVDYSINRDGTIGDVALVRTSGYTILDEAVIKALRKCKFWPLPDSWDGEDLRISGKFTYIFGPVQIM